MPKSDTNLRGVNPDYPVGAGRCRLARRQSKGYFVIHDSEGPDGSSEGLLRFMGNPATETNVASYHAVTREDGSYTQILDPQWAPYSAPPLNDYAMHVCMPGKAAQTREQWLDPISSKYIEGVVAFIKDWCFELDIPKEYLTVPQLIANGIEGLHGGYTSHDNVSDAWHKSSHYDPGSEFPWDVLANLLAEPDSNPPVNQHYPIGADGVRRFIFKWDTNTAVMICHTDLLTYWTSFKNAEQYYTAVMHPDFLQDFRGQDPAGLGIPFILKKTSWPQLVEKQMGDATIH